MHTQTVKNELKQIGAFTDTSFLPPGERGPPCFGVREFSHKLLNTARCALLISVVTYVLAVPLISSF